MSRPIVHINTPFKNEAWLFRETLKEWAKYPVDKFVFVDDNSVDAGDMAIKEILGDRAVILKSRYSEWHESGNRSECWEYSRSNMADVIISLDADELLSTVFLDNWDDNINQATSHVLCCPQYNLVGGLRCRRTDPAYYHNVREFVLPVKHSRHFSNNGLYHSPRTPAVLAPCVESNNYTFLHLQSIDRLYYALKQLYYKAYELVVYRWHPTEINARYDNVVNHLDFYPQAIEGKYIRGIDIDCNIFQQRVADDPRFKQLAGWVTADYNKFKPVLTFGSDEYEIYLNLYYGVGTVSE